MNKTPLLTLLGSCRINGLSEHFQTTDLAENVSYLHTTKEILQFLNFIINKKEIPADINRYCFRSGILKYQNIEYDESFKNKILNTDIFVLEISTCKNYMYNEYCIQHLTLDEKADYRKITPKFILDNINITQSSKDEIERDILEIQKLLLNKPIIVVSHIDPKINGQYLERRHRTITDLKEICEKNNIPFFDPSVVLQEYDQSQIVDTDLIHFTSRGKQIITQSLVDLVKTVIFTVVHPQDKNFSYHLH